MIENFSLNHDFSTEVSHDSLPFSQDLYDSTLKPKLIQLFNYSNPLMAPKLLKIVLNMTTSDAVSDSTVIKKIFSELQLISGQKPVILKSRSSIAAFRLRQGMDIGCKVTLRSENMFSFLAKFVICALAREKDFKGFSIKSFDGRGNFSCGVKEQIIFPELGYGKVDKSRGLDVSFVTTAKTDVECKALLTLFRIPFFN